MDLVCTTTPLSQGGRGGQVQTTDSLMARAKGIGPFADTTRNHMSLNLKAVLDTPEGA